MVWNSHRKNKVPNLYLPYQQSGKQLQSLFGLQNADVCRGLMCAGVLRALVQQPSLSIAAGIIPYYGHTIWNTHYFTWKEMHITTCRHVCWRWSGAFAFHCIFSQHHLSLRCYSVISVNVVFLHTSIDIFLTSFLHRVWIIYRVLDLETRQYACDIFHRVQPPLGGFGRPPGENPFQKTKWTGPTEIRTRQWHSYTIWVWIVNWVSGFIVRNTIQMVWSWFSLSLLRGNVDHLQTMKILKSF